MPRDTKMAVVDTDFVIHLVASDIKDEEIICALSTAFNDLGLMVVMHPLVYEHELPKDKPRIQLLFNSGILNEVTIEEIFQGDGSKEYYIFLVTEMFQGMHNVPMPVSGDDVLSYWERKQSLGEIHSIAMCLVCGSGIFLSDDHDSQRLKSYIERKSLGKIEVYNRKAFFEMHLKENANPISRKTRRSLAHKID